MRYGKQILLGTLIGLAACVYLTFTRPRLQADKPAVPTPIATTSAAPTPTPVTPVVAGTASIKVLLYGITLTVTDPVNDLVYGEIKDGSNTWAGFTTESLLARYPNCKAGALGTLVRIKATPTPTPKPSPSKSPSAYASSYPTRTPANQPFKKTVGGYTYSYRPSYSTCTTDQAGRDKLTAARAAIVNGILPTLSN